MTREVHAPAERVWDLITGIDRWPSWNPAISEAHQRGPLVKGARFRWKAGPGTIVSTIEDADPPPINRMVRENHGNQGSSHLDIRGERRPDPCHHGRVVGWRVRPVIWEVFPEDPGTIPRVVARCPPGYSGTPGSRWEMTTYRAVPFYMKTAPPFS